MADPGFWRRFSIAVHADEEAKAPGANKDAVLFSYASLLFPYFASSLPMTTLHLDKIAKKNITPERL